MCHVVQTTAALESVLRFGIKESVLKYVCKSKTSSIKDDQQHVSAVEKDDQPVQWGGTEKSLLETEDNATTQVVGSNSSAAAIKPEDTEDQQKFREQQAEEAVPCRIHADVSEFPDGL